MSESERAATDIAYAYELRAPKLRGVCEALETEVRHLLRFIPRIDRVAFRVKDSDSFADKVLKPRPMPYSHPHTEVEDQIAGRVITFFLGDLENVESNLTERFTAVENVHKEPPKDAEFGYESHHFVFILPPDLLPDEWDESDMPKTFELQLRTLLMHAWAEPQHDLMYKGPEDLSREMRRELAWVAASTWGADQAFQRVNAALSSPPS